MGRKVKGSLRHLRRSVAPPFWPIKRKEYVWTVKPSPGPHSLLSSIPIGIVLRDVFGYAKTMKEARRILASRVIEVDGRVVTDYKFPVGLMDVLHIIPEEKYYRVVPDPARKLRFVEIKPEEAGYKLAQIRRKMTVKNGDLQFTLHDGRNVLIRKGSEAYSTAISYKTYDALLITIPRQSIVSHVPFEVGTLAIVVDGRNVGFMGRINAIQQVFKRSRALVELEDASGAKSRTILQYVLPVGKEKPLVTVTA
ncbi:30S ribosomal protein S4e [Thermofilum pendens]|uniref:Small ribosomal subunit protein eS4 n=1 Tax=Thermofilum pendens (strain DSM 2475 / Hrk 5) TaxID=368408 RepID=A1RWS3_THEPD|nr:30S ribosomal protein S4e [Thermofilum pendens]ABL77653.1 SSU ribosomal protein S4E [Thermofilum pendens Hrk 5]